MGCISLYGNYKFILPMFLPSVELILFCYISKKLEKYQTNAVLLWKSKYTFHSVGYCSQKPLCATFMQGILYLILLTAKNIFGTYIIMSYFFRDYQQAAVFRHLTLKFSYISVPSFLKCVDSVISIRKEETEC